MATGLGARLEVREGRVHRGNLCVKGLIDKIAAFSGARDRLLDPWQMNGMAKPAINRTNESRGLIPPTAGAQRRERAAGVPSRIYSRAEPALIPSQ